ncbi:MAG: hypothetical protein IJ870_01650 [Alphaproteobacteria bacterium]|nr:hypothetical protein [Alphaproteobacteria bacterium]
MSIRDKINESKERVKRKQLLDRALFVPCEVSKGQRLSVDELLKQMVKTSAERKLPVKSEFEGHEFSIDAGMPMGPALKAWKDQACMPWLEEMPPQDVADVLNDTSKATRIENNSRSFQEAAAVEILVTKYPEHADKLTTLQLLNSFYRAKEENVGNLETALDASLNKYLAGEQTFPVTLQNVVTLQQLRESYSAMKLEDPQKLNDRMAQTELEMLQNLTPNDLTYVSDKLLADGFKIAQKHKEKGDFTQIFQNELMQNRLGKGNIFDPRQ